MAENTQSPGGLIHEMSCGFILSQALYGVAKLGIADFIHDRQSSIVELGLSAGADKRVLYRVMRALAGFGVFHEEEGRFFSLTPAGQLLCSDHPQSLRHAVIFRCEENYDAFRAIVHSVRTGENAFKSVFGAPRFEYLKSKKEANGRKGETVGDRQNDRPTKPTFLCANCGPYCSGRTRRSRTQPKGIRDAFPPSWIETRSGD